MFTQTNNGRGSSGLVDATARVPEKEQELQQRSQAGPKKFLPQMTHKPHVTRKRCSSNEVVGARTLEYHWSHHNIQKKTYNGSGSGLGGLQIIIMTGCTLQEEKMRVLMASRNGITEEFTDHTTTPMTFTTGMALVAITLIKMREVYVHWRQAGMDHLKIQWSHHNTHEVHNRNDSGLDLCGLMTTGLSEDIRCHVTCKSPDQTTGHT